MEEAALLAEVGAISETQKSPWAAAAEHSRGKPRESRQAGEAT